MMAEVCPETLAEETPLHPPQLHISTKIVGHDAVVNMYANYVHIQCGLHSVKNGTNYC